jgi:hypothetical protein
VKTVNQLRISATRHDPKGLDVKELSSSQRREKCFLLTSPFIELERKKKPVFIRGLNLNHNHDLKNLFKSAATSFQTVPKFVPT